MNIKKLSKETINLISAGEVIEGPSDILKELLENSVDAGATEIEINIKNSGVDFLQVKDNGHGMSKDDLEISIERHTTSKLSKIDDLYSINSFGFRGEALASISAVSKFSISSSTTDSGKGYILENNKLKEINLKKGTTITVSDLFYNLPVRKKFLKSKATEFANIYDLFLAFVLLYPKTRFVFNSEKKKIVFQNTTKENRFLQIFGSDIKRKTINLNISNELFELSGIISNPKDQFYFPTNFLFINNRLVYSTQVQKTITSVFKDYLMVQQKPFFILFLKFNPKTIDVNVHPKKRIVKIQNEMLFLSLLRSELENKLYAKEESSNQSKTLLDYAIEYTEKKSVLEESRPIINYTSSKVTSPFASDTKFIQKSIPEISIAPPLNLNSDTDLILDGKKITRIIGQIHNTYILCETTSGFLLIDQHAAAERINLEKNRNLYAAGFSKQKLLVRKIVPNLSAAHKSVLNKNKDKIEALGFDYEKKGDNYYLITIPKLFDKYFDDSIFLNLVDDLVSGENTVTKLRDNLIKLFTCKNSIKANEFLSFSEQVKLIKELDACSDKKICAHGRPTIQVFTIKDLEKMFKRIV